MKMKLALFMFAIGLGSSYAYADTPSYCVRKCYAAYDRCVLTQPQFDCHMQEENCIYDCKGWLP
ncbi:hypothetical protein ACFOLJ_19955 [Rugamonas sp. CCM 8940]|uniref:hypothetical protein n=1 Tax=Rugamonas sp. CCM 8940 TaxID=2765359 RepID=UPI0018F349CB|nr:hypothetical protein [Rugamonas sp. CCM 8940]MBJ7313842.1 hypothetical protein [Rugamonas sp. CCM 8940]